MLAISYLIILLAALGIATVIDIKRRKIPNWLTVSVTIIGLANSAFTKGLPGLGEHTLAMLVGLILFFIFYLVKVFGAGDAKLMAAIGAVMGFPFILIVSLAVILVGGVISLVILLKNRGFSNVLFFIYSFFRSLFTGRLREFNDGVTEEHDNTFPFSVAITIGSVMTLWYVYPSLTI